MFLTIRTWSLWTFLSSNKALFSVRCLAVWCNRTWLIRTSQFQSQGRTVYPYNFNLQPLYNSLHSRCTFHKVKALEKLESLNAHLDKKTPDDSDEPCDHSTAVGVAEPTWPSFCIRVRFLPLGLRFAFPAFLSRGIYFTKNLSKKSHEQDNPNMCRKGHQPTCQTAWEKAYKKNQKLLK